MTNTKNDPILDIAQRIAEALARTGEPAATATLGTFDPAQDTVIGTVPVHLQHLHNLLDEITKEVIAAEQRSNEAKQRRDALRAIFFDALATRVPSTEYDGVKICKGWQVVGLKMACGGDCGGFDLSEMLQAAMARARAN